MTAPLSPDEGVRAALEAAKARIDGLDIIVEHREPLDDELAVVEWRTIRLCKEAIAAALSTPVPEEGLPRGSASAAEGDELERLRDALGVATQALEKIAEPTNGKEPGFTYLEQRRKLATITLIALSQASHVGPLAPSQLSMPSAMFGDIPSDVLDRAKDALRACRHEWDDDTKDHSTAAFFMAARAIMLDRALASTEAGDGVASALPSPLPSQGEPVGTIWGVYLNDGRFMDKASDDKQTAIDMAEASYEPEDFHVHPLYTAEALAAERNTVITLKARLSEAEVCDAILREDYAEIVRERDAERARADSLKRERDDAVAKLKALAVEDYKAGQDMAKSAEVEIAELRARADRAEEALKPFAERVPACRLDDLSFPDDDIVAKAGQPLGDFRRARTILKETAHDER